MSLAIYDKYITRTDSGETIPSATVQVNIPGGGLASLFDARVGGSPVANPFPADSNGRATFYLAEGRYNITATSVEGSVVYSDVFVARHIPNQPSRSTLRTALANDVYSPGDTPSLASTTNPGINGPFVVENGTTDDGGKFLSGGTLQARRLYDGPVLLSWYEPTIGGESGPELAAAFATGEPVDIGDGNTYQSSQDLTLQSKLIGNGSEIAFTGTNGMLLGEGASVDRHVKISQPPTGGRADLIRLGNKAVFSGEVEGISDNGAYGLSLNSSDRDDVVVDGAKVTGYGFGLLANESATGSGLKVSNSHITGTHGDAIEINLPNDAEFYDITITGNTLSAGEDGSTAVTVAGFALGIAEGKNMVNVGNLSKYSIREGYHIEDDSYGIVTSCNLFAGNITDGSRILTRSGQKGLNHVGNSFIKNRDLTELAAKGSAWRTDNGYYVIIDGDGSSRGGTCVGNYAEGFNVGFNLGQDQFLGLAGNSSYDCNYAVSMPNSGIAIGDHIAFNCDTGVQSRGSIGPLIVTDNNDIQLVARFSSFAVGATCEGKASKVTVTTVAAGNVDVPIFLAGADERFDGTLICTMARGSTESATGSYNLAWDGTTLTATTNWSKNNGAKSAVVPHIANGYLNWRIFSSAGGQAVETRYVFRGNYYSESVGVGTHTGSNNASVLTDANRAYTVNDLIGLTVTNITDGSSGTITANTATTVTATLSGGTDNDWDTGDRYSIA